jgi:hypothetical protein
MSTFTCSKCGKKYFTTAKTIPRKKICIACRRKQGLLNEESKHLQKEIDRLRQGKKLSENDEKGILLEFAVSKTLDELEIPHKANPFDITYPCYQEDNPDIIVEALNTTLECKNLNRLQTNHLTRGWLDRNVIDRPKVTAFEEKIVVFGYRPKESIKLYLKTKGWRTCAAGSQILTSRQAIDAVPKLKQELIWLREKLKARQQLPFYT